MDTSTLDSLILCLEAKNLIDYTSLFSPYDFEENDDIIFDYFKNE